MIHIHLNKDNLSKKERMIAMEMDYNCKWGREPIVI